jgi:adenylate kinase
MNLIILGSPGSGKGTQAELLAKKLGLYYFQTGKFSRELAKNNKKIRKIMNSGKLIPQGVMANYVKEFLERKKPDAKNILYEGYPRFIPQYEYLKKRIGLKGQKIDAVISLDISEEEAIKRLASRRMCEKCGEVYNLVTNPPLGKKCKCGGKLMQRDDDKPESIKVRFQDYRNNTKKLIDYVEKEGNLIRIDGERPIDTIFEDILKRIEK